MIPISGKTCLACLLGHPASHSLSPAMQTRAFQECGIDCVYLAFDPGDDLKEAVDGLKSLHAIGFNLTMPYKKRILPLLDEILPAGDLAGAVNTVKIEGDRLIGTTTDGRGFLDSLREEGVESQGLSMTLLGAGGAATAIAAQAALDGMKEIRIFKRKNATFPQALAFGEKLQEKTSCRVRVLPMEDKDLLAWSIGSSDLLVNATNVGMGTDDTSLVPPSALRKDLFTADIIYHPDKTRLLREADSVGARTMNGKYMLLYQGAASFAFWTGKEMPVDVIKKSLFERI